MVLLLLLLSAPPDAEKLFAEGKAAYEAGRFDDAIVSFERAYRVRPLPAFLFNIGQCHFQMQRWQRASFFYERYLELAPRAPDRAVVEDLLAESRARSAEPPWWLWLGVGGVAGVAATGVVWWAVDGRF